jgi:hypothetical protein
MPISSYQKKAFPQLSSHAWGTVKITRFAILIGPMQLSLAIKTALLRAKPDDAVSSLLNQNPHLRATRLSNVWPWTIAPTLGFRENYGYWSPLHCEPRKQLQVVKTSIGEADGLLYITLIMTFMVSSPVARLNAAWRRPPRGRIDPFVETSPAPQRAFSVKEQIL